MSVNAEQRKLAAIMFTDMVGYSALSQRDDKLALELLEEHRELLRKIFAEFNGTEIKTIGDGFLVEFNSALEAAQCAIAIQRALAKRNADAPAERQIQVRIGVHIGDVIHRGGDVFGDGVNIASRIEQLAGAGGICVSMDVERQIRNAVETRFEKLAPTELKNISVPMDLFRIVLPWERQWLRAATHETGEKRASVSNGTIVLSGIFLVIVIAVGWWWTAGSHKNVAPSRPESGAPATPNTESLAVHGESSTGVRPSIPEKSIAVLPFENLSDDKSTAYFSDGITEEILNALAQIPGLKVAARRSAFQFKGSDLDLQKIGRTLGVAHILEGSLQKAGDQVRINVQLVDVKNGLQAWSEKYDRKLDNVFAVEDEIANPGFRRFELAVAHYVGGDRAAADAALADLIANAAREGFAYQIAEVYALRGEKDKAFEWLQTALDDRDAGMLGLSADPLLRGLRDDARYKNLLTKIGLPTTP